MNWFSVGPALALPPGNVCLKNIPTVHSGFRLLKIAISMTCPRFAAPGRKPLLRGIRRRARAGLAPASFSDGFYYTTKAPAFQFQKAVFSRAVSRPAGQKIPRNRSTWGRSGGFSILYYLFVLFVKYIFQGADLGGAGGGQNACHQADDGGKGQRQQHQPGDTTDTAEPLPP